MYKSAILIAFMAVGLAVASDYGHDNNYYGDYEVYGQWGYWGEWSDCSKTCGGGSQTRTRECKRPYHYYGEYKGCKGDDSEERECNTDGCPVDGAWSEWGDFGDCSVDCGYGEKTRTRTCTNPEPANGGADCYGSDTDKTYCFVYKCPVDGAWSKWSYWTSCSGNCGTGYRVRSRSCTYPAPANGGDDCEGDSSETETCKHYRQCYHHGSSYGYHRQPYYYNRGYGRRDFH